MPLPGAVPSVLRPAVRRLLLPGSASVTNNIGAPGTAGFGVGVYPGGLPSGFSAMSGTTTVGSDNYGNYQYSDGSIMCWVPMCYVKIGTGSNGLAVNVFDIRPGSYYPSVAAANADGYSAFRADYDGGEFKRGQFVDKYECSNNGGVASSIKNGLPLSTNAAHNPLSGLTGISTNNYATCIDAAKTRGSNFFPASRFMQIKLAILATAHGQAATSTSNCAWYDSGGTTNFPKGNNNNALGDTNDGTISYTSDGYSNCGKTGSGTPFSKTTHNGQACGVADLNGNMSEVSLGITRDSGNNDFYVLKTSVALKDLTSGSGSGNDAWGNAAHLATLYDVLTATHITNANAWERYGNGANQVLDEAVSGNGWLLTGLGLPRDADAQSAGGTNLFGADGLYELHPADLCAISGGDWNDGSRSGVWTGTLNGGRTTSAPAMGFRAACYA